MPLSTDTSMAIPTGPKGDSMNHVAGVRCTICGRVMPYQEQMTCPHCGEKGILDILFDYYYIIKDFTLIFSGLSLSIYNSISLPSYIVLIYSCKGKRGAMNILQVL